MAFIENLVAENMLAALIVLVIGFVFLIKGADFFVEGSSSIAKKFKVPAIIIGMTIVAMGTSLPETAVSVTASITNNNELAVGNAVGSNIFNLMVVIGCCCLFQVVEVDKKTLTRDLPFSVICAILLAVLGFLGNMILGHVDGIIMLCLFAAFIVVMIRATKAARKSGEVSEAEEDAENLAVMSVPKSLIYILIGMVGIALGGDWVVDSACAVATNFGISQTIIGLTVVALGTSLPELATSVVAARKGEVDMALGNAIGSNVFNILMVLGIAATLSPIPFLTINIIDIIILIVFSLIVWAFAWKKQALNRANGLIMILLYVIYVIYICMR